MLLMLQCSIFRWFHLYGVLSANLALTKKLNGLILLIFRRYGLYAWDILSIYFLAPSQLFNIVGCVYGFSTASKMAAKYLKLQLFAL